MKLVYGVAFDDYDDAYEFIKQICPEVPEISDEFYEYLDNRPTIGDLSMYSSIPKGMSTLS